MRYRRIEWIEPIEAAERLAGLPGLALLDSAMGHPRLGRYSYLAADPFGRFVARDGIATWNGTAEAGAPLDALRARLAVCRCERMPGLPPFQGGAIGVFAYELGWLIEGRANPLPWLRQAQISASSAICLLPLREKVPEGRMRGRSHNGGLPSAKDQDRATPHPALRATFSRKGEKEAAGSARVNAEALGATREGDDIHLAFHDIVVAFDHEQRSCWLIASGLPAATPDARADRAEARLVAFAERVERCRKASEGEKAPAPQLVWFPTISRDAYHAAIERVREYIRDGDIYQANIAQRFVAALPEGVDPWRLYRVLREKNPAPFAAYLDCGARKILSTSPELFLRTDGRQVETRPIKGTARREADPAADHAAGAGLVASRKDRAENVMIVDLLRNDFSKVCLPESVDVPLLCGLESYAGLHHLVSAVTGELRADADALDLLAACFPGGSITGAPKLRAMEIIAGIEGAPRGVYCGAIGALGFDGGMVLNIAIRTLVVDGATIELAAGGGITMLSDPDAEYEETLTKARRLLEAFVAAPEPRCVSAGAGA